MTFAEWIDTFVSEKGIDLEQILKVDGEAGENFIPVGCLIDVMKQTGAGEQQQIKATIVKIDFCNGDVLHYFKHLAKAVAI
jgi:hypothetical protein